MAKNRTFKTSLSSLKDLIVAANTSITTSKDLSKGLRDSDEGKKAAAASKAKQVAIGDTLCAVLSLEVDHAVLTGMTKEALANKDEFNETYAKLDVGEHTVRLYRRLGQCAAIIAYVPANSTPAKVKAALAKVEWTNPKGKKVTGIGETPSQMRKFMEAHTAVKKYDDGVTDEAIKFLAEYLATSLKTANLAGHLDATHMRIDGVIGVACQDMFQLMVTTDIDETDPMGEVDFEDGVDLPMLNISSAADDADNKKVAGSI